MSELADELLRGPHLLRQADRELIATYVSAANDCVYCQTVHGAIAAHFLGGDELLVAQVKEDFLQAPISGKLKALLMIAHQVQRGDKKIRVVDINRARRQGATDLEIHDTILIASMFCMCTGKWAGPRRARTNHANGQTRVETQPASRSKVGQTNKTIG